jgi:hypothetical protein
MNISGRKWDDSDAVGRQYVDGKIDGVKAKLHQPNLTEYPLEEMLIFVCDLCHTDYRHWLCDDKVWHRLPNSECDGSFVGFYWEVTRIFLRIKVRIAAKQLGQIIILWTALGNRCHTLSSQSQCR